MIKSAAILFGIVFLVVGILGFVPAVAPDEMLFKIFHVNAAHNIVHIASGIIFLLAAMAGVGAAKTWFKVFGIIYAVVAIWGFAVGTGNTLWVVSNNPAVTGVADESARPGKDIRAQSTVARGSWLRRWFIPLRAGAAHAVQKLSRDRTLARSNPQRCAQSRQPG